MSKGDHRGRVGLPSGADEDLEPDRWWSVRRTPTRLTQLAAIVILVATIWSYVGSAPLALRIVFAVVMATELITATVLMRRKYLARRRYLRTAAPVDDDGP
jgi:hypothetical protein